MTLGMTSRERKLGREVEGISSSVSHGYLPPCSMPRFIEKKEWDIISLSPSSAAIVSHFCAFIHYCAPPFLPSLPVSYRFEIKIKFSIPLDPRFFDGKWNSPSSTSAVSYRYIDYILTPILSRIRSYLDHDLVRLIDLYSYRCSLVKIYRLTALRPCCESKGARNFLPWILFPSSDRWRNKSFARHCSKLD